MLFDIYKHTNIITGKSYIGYSVKGWEHRWKSHIRGSEYGSQTHFHNAIRKYGPDSFTHEILHQCDNKIEAQSIEIFYISWYNTLSNGYNMTSGGDGGDTNSGKILGPRPSMMGSKNPFYGKKHSSKLMKQITKSIRITKKIKMDTNPDFYKGYKHTQEARAEMSKNRKNNPKYAQKHSTETKTKISNSNKGKKRSIKQCESQSQMMKSLPDIICQYCGTIGRPGAGMNRWHGENCKKK